MSKKTSTWVVLCADEDIAEGSREVFEVDGKWIAVFRVSGKLYAIEDLCTHDGGTLTERADGSPVPLDGYEIECPRHGGRFDIRSGKAVHAPALIDVPWYETRVQDGMIEIAL
ncbi:MAG: non-heme iron oxygenase ferredoxin subunit [Anaerolineae bacterium]|nr:non-heme iron oxygenase ferredoxin subunit [Anaerolineae bacterium]MDW8173325.1 non-heme iron oxygenase ferredoxin subunit [Anaerolineae bacterium]